jgi:DNA-binding transcriptional MerR regulator
VTATLRVGEVAAAAGVNIETLRYYERRGLLVRPDRSLGGHRLYPVETVARLRVIKVAQHLGFTLGEVSELLEAGRHHHGAARSGGLHDRASGKLVEVEQKITDLIVIRDTLRAAVAAGCDDLATCAANEACPLPFADLAARG